MVLESFFFKLNVETFICLRITKVSNCYCIVQNSLFILRGADTFVLFAINAQATPVKIPNAQMSNSDFLTSIRTNTVTLLP